jgi:thioredoxin-like negative regulator of GroEL
MTRISIFGKTECAKCKTTKHKLSHLFSGELDHKVEVVFHDMETLDGRAEGAFYDVNKIPLTVVEQEGREVARWAGEVPESQDIHRLILGA